MHSAASKSFAQNEYSINCNQNTIFETWPDLKHETTCIIQCLSSWHPKWPQYTVRFCPAVADRFQKYLPNPKAEIVNILETEYIQSTSSPMTNSHKSQHGTGTKKSYAVKIQETFSEVLAVLSRLTWKFRSYSWPNLIVLTGTQVATTLAYILLCIF